MLSLHTKSMILLCLIFAFPIGSHANMEGGLLSYFSSPTLSDSLALYGSLYNPSENSTDSIYRGQARYASLPTSIPSSEWPVGQAD